MTKGEFIRRVGDPQKFIFKGQCYDAGPVNRQHCAVCGRAIRQVFVLRNQQNGRVYFGSGCINYFKSWNKPLHRSLAASKIWLQTWIKAETRDTQAFIQRAKTKQYEQVYVQMRKDAAAAIRAYHVRTGKEWLTEELFRLQQLSSEPKPIGKPEAREKWYVQRTTEIRLLLGSASIYPLPNFQA